MEFASERRIEDPIVTLWMPFDGSHDVEPAVDVAIMDAVRSKAKAQVGLLSKATYDHRSRH